MTGEKKNPLREHWGGSLGFVLAAAGSAIGLGNLWKFPYITGQNGGGAFVLVYLLCIAVIGLPVMICEITLGRYAQKDPIGAFQKIAPTGSAATRSAAFLLFLFAFGLLCFGKFGLAGLFFLVAALSLYYGWGVIGVLCVVTPFFILSYYGTVGGWTIAYFFKGLFQQLNFNDPVSAGQTFATFINNPYQSVFFQLLFMGCCGSVLWFGVKNGIELASKFLLPLLFLIILVLIMRGLTLPGSSEGVRFFLTPDFSTLTTGSVLAALGLAFFSLSLGMGAIMTYGSYLDQGKNILSSSLFIVLSDTMFALLAGLAIFPAVMAMGMKPSEGPGLIFQIMPMTFNAIGDHFGWLWSSIFFLLTFIAALTSGISIAEACIACLIDHYKMKRHSAVFWVISVASLFGVFCSLSVTNWDHFPLTEKMIAMAFGSADNSLFDLIDHFSTNYLLPLGGLGIALFVGWRWGTRHAIAEIRKGGGDVADVNFFSLLAGLKDDPLSKARTHTLTLAVILGIFIRFLCPIGIIAVFLYNVGWISI